MHRYEIKVPSLHRSAMETAFSEGGIRHSLTQGYVHIVYDSLMAKRCYFLDQMARPWGRLPVRMAYSMVMA